MRGTTRLLVLFGAIFVVVAGSIVFIITRMTSSVMHGATRTTDPSAMMSTIGDTMIWTAVPIVLITAAGILVFFFFMRRFMGANQRLVATGIPGTALQIFCGAPSRHIPQRRCRSTLVPRRTFQTNPSFL